VLCAPAFDLGERLVFVVRGALLARLVVGVVFRFVAVLALADRTGLLFFVGAFLVVAFVLFEDWVAI
jgi:hypothetical protein